MSAFKKTLKIVGALAAIMLIGLSALGFANHVRAASVLTGSMRPHYAPGTLILTKQVNTRSLHVGQVVAFRPPAPFTTPHNKPIMHRIIDVQHVGSQVLLRTKGDANPAPDPWLLDLRSSTSHVAAYSVPYVGTLLTAFNDSNLKVRMFTLAGALLIATAWVLWPRPKSGRPQTAAVPPGPGQLAL